MQQVKSEDVEMEHQSRDDLMVKAITGLVNRMVTQFDNDQFMTVMNLRCSLKYNVRTSQDKPLKYGGVKSCDQNRKRDLKQILFNRTPDSCSSLDSY